jgi:hypothetical protein
MEIPIPVAMGMTVATNPRMIMTTDQPMDVPAASLKTFVLCELIFILLSETFREVE